MPRNGVYISSFSFPFLFQPTLNSSKNASFLSFTQKTGTDFTKDTVIKYNKSTVFREIRA